MFYFSASIFIKAVQWYVARVIHSADKRNDRMDTKVAKYMVKAELADIVVERFKGIRLNG